MTAPLADGLLGLTGSSSWASPLTGPLSFVHPFPSPIAFWVGTWPIHWYGLAYGVGALLAWGYGRQCLKSQQFPGVSTAILDGLVNWSMACIVIGGRLGHVLLYAPGHYLSHLLEILQPWKGGMAFHGGVLGLAAGLWLYSRRHRLGFWSLADLVCCGAPIGLGLGRLANFVNQEVWGRPTDQTWGVVFPQVDGLLRHPSQLYEAFAEGPALFGLLAWGLWRRRWSQKPGLCTGVFLAGYAGARIVCELFRSPDGVWAGLTLGQWYSLPMLMAGLAGIARVCTRQACSQPVA